MAKKARVLDSWAMIAFFENEAGGERVEQVLTEAHQTGSPLYMSIVNVGEVWYNIARSHSKEVADAKIQELRTLRIEFVEADWEITKQAAVFKTKGNIAYADCFAAALAKIKKAELVTGDKEFKQTEGEVTILWI